MIINFFLRKMSKNKFENLKKSSSITRVRYSETDQMGVVYHGNYAQYFELGRTEWLRELGITYKSMEKKGIILPVISLNCTFIKSALYDDLLKITTTLVKKPMVKIEFSYEIRNENEDLICTGTSILAFMSSKTGKPIKCPKIF